MEQGKSWTLDDSTSASNPGGVELQLWTWFRHAPFWPSVFIAATAVTAAAGYFLHVSFFGVAVIVFLAMLFYWARVREHFALGCANPGLILATDPLVYAVRTNLSKGRGDFPVVRVMCREFVPVRQDRAEEGARIMTVALYQAGDEEDPGLPHWVSFNPLPVDCATRDPRAVEASFRSVDEYEWEELSLAVAQIPKPVRPGIYPVEVEDSSWAETDSWRRLQG